MFITVLLAVITNTSRETYAYTACPLNVDNKATAYVNSEALGMVNCAIKSQSNIAATDMTWWEKTYHCFNSYYGNAVSFIQIAEQ